MPAVSVAQRRAIGIAEHEPGKLFARNRGLLGMKHKDMHDFASTKEAGLPEHVNLNLGRKGGALRRAAMGGK